MPAPPRTRKPTWRRLFSVLQLLVVGTMLAISWPTSLGGQISYVQVSGQSMYPTYESGDLVVTREQPTYRAGDPVVYRIPKGEVGAGAQIVHRIIGGNGHDGFFLRGDNNSYDDSWHPTNDDVVGRVVLHLPDAGTWLAYLVRPINLGILCGSLTVVSVLWPRRERPARRRNAPDDAVSEEEASADDEPAGGEEPPVAEDAPAGEEAQGDEAGESSTVEEVAVAEADPAEVSHRESLV